MPMLILLRATLASLIALNSCFLSRKDTDQSGSRHLIIGALCIKGTFEGRNVELAHANDPDQEQVTVIEYKDYGRNAQDQRNKNRNHQKAQVQAFEQVIPLGAADCLGFLVWVEAICLFELLHEIDVTFLGRGL